MADHPYMLFSPPTVGKRETRSNQFPRAGRTAIDGQKQRGRLSSRLERFQASIANAELASTVDGAAPDLVIVLEARENIVGVARAAQNLGIEVIGEAEFEGLEFDEIERAELHDRDATIERGALYLTIGDAASRQHLLADFQSYQKGAEAPYGRSPLWSLFDTLHDIRLWNAEDRIAGTGLVTRLHRMIADGDDRARLEVELWYRGGEQSRDQARDLWMTNVGDSASIVDESVIEEIAYHGLLVEVPLGYELVERVRTADEAAPAWLLDARVRAVRPAAQFVTVGNGGDEDVVEARVIREPDGGLPQGDPLVAVLDGLPQAGHPILMGRVELDDPDNWGSTIRVEERRHGTAMCSIVCHGDLHRSGRSLRRPIYARPIIRPAGGWIAGREEMPPDRLAVDVLQEAVLRAVESRPSIRIVNLSIGDGDAAHLRQASPLARLIDLLSWRLGLLFIVSAGNRPQDVTMDGIAPGGVSVATREARHFAAMASISRESVQRRLRPPGEAVNALTVGASHDDRSGFIDGLGGRFEIVANGAPSPVSAHGPGLSRSIKPDVLLPGGRLIYQEPVATPTAGDAIVEIPGIAALRTAPPGTGVARPGVPVGGGSQTGYSWGTSDAAAYASHLAGALLEEAPERIDGFDPETEDPAVLACLAKAMVAHTASHGDWYPGLVSEFAAYPKHKRALASRIAGNGAVLPEHALRSDLPDNIVTLVAVGEVAPNDTLTYTFPIPDELSGVACGRTLVVTLATILPTLPWRSAYRPHWVEVDVPAAATRAYGFGSRTNNDNNAVRRGALQHERWEALKPGTWGTGSELRLCVIGRTRLDDRPVPMPFAVIATLEASDPAVPIYQSVRARVRQPIRAARVGVVT